MFTSASADEANAAIAGWVERSETHHRCVGKDDDGYRFAPSILRTISTRHCEPTGRAKRARWLAMTLMGHSILNARTRRHIEPTPSPLSQIANASHATRRRTVVEIATCPRQCADALRSNFCRHTHRMVNLQVIVRTSAGRRLQTVLEGRVRVLFHTNDTSPCRCNRSYGACRGYTRVQL